jgi:hypothetical protein
MGININLHTVTILLILIISIAEKGYSQQLSKQDTVLYLIFDATEHHWKSDTRVYDPVAKKENWEWHYAYLTDDAHMYDGYPLRFVSNSKKQNDTVCLSELNQRYNVVTYNQLYQFISQNYKVGYVGYEGAAYFKNLKQIYMVEIDEKQQLAVITPVKIDIVIE